ncbi:MAG TPA: hypothetical protein PLI90_06395 [Rhodocyclaceae bacterium]|nr:hypothetical protein [Rhodocyclaceae bacterium]
MRGDEKLMRLPNIHGQRRICLNQFAGTSETRAQDKRFVYPIAPAGFYFVIRIDWSCTEARINGGPYIDHLICGKSKHLSTVFFGRLRNRQQQICSTQMVKPVLVPGFTSNISEIFLAIDRGQQIPNDRRCRNGQIQRANADDDVACFTFEKTSDKNNVWRQAGQERLANRFLSAPSPAVCTQGAAADRTGFPNQDIFLRQQIVK